MEKKPVSYTHLDVYKRQSCDSGGPGEQRVRDGTCGDKTG